MEFRGKSNHSPSGGANLHFKKSKNRENLEIKTHVCESVGNDEKLPGWPGHSIFRMLIPDWLDRRLGCAFPLTALEKYEDIKAQIKFIIGPSRTRMVMVSAKEEPHSSLPPAVDGLLRVNKFFLDWLRDSYFTPIVEDKFVTSLRVPAVQASSLINSSTINSIEQVCNCDIKILGEGHSVSPLQDVLVGVQGKSEGVHKAIESIASYLRKFLVDQSIIPTIEMQYYLLEKPPHHGISLYGREASMLVYSSSDLLAQSEEYLGVQILQLYADAILGIEGANITCIRRLTGATFTVEEMQEVPDRIFVEIRGQSSQVFNAEQLMLMFIAEAGGPQSTDSLYKVPIMPSLASVSGGSGDLPPIKPSLANQTGGDGSLCGTTRLNFNDTTYYINISR